MRKLKHLLYVQGFKGKYGMNRYRNLSRGMETKKNNQGEITEMKGIISEMKHSLNGLNSRLKIAEDRISELINMIPETNQTEI